MNQRNLLILFAALPLLAIAAWLLSQDDTSSLSEGDPFLSDLAEMLNEVETLTVRRAGNTVLVNLERKDGSWLVTNRDDYPANFDRVRQNLRGLADARIFEAKTANPEFYERLGVRDISDTQATGSEFDIRAGDYSTKLIVGRTDEGGGSLAYVRRAGEGQSYLVRASLDPGSSAADWLDTAILDLPSARVRSVEIRHADGEILAIAKPRSESTNYTVADVPEGRSLSYDGAANSIGAALASLRLDDVQPAASFDAGDVEPVVARFDTFNGLSVEVRTWALEDRTLHAFSAVAGEATPELAPEVAENDAPADTDALAQINAEVDAINARVAEWIYVVPSFKAEQFTRRMSELLAAEE